MYVSIVNVYLSRHVNLFLRHIYLFISISIQLDDHVIKLGQQFSVVKIRYSRDDLLSLNNPFSPTSNSLCVTIDSLGNHA